MKSEGELFNQFIELADYFIDFDEAFEKIYGQNFELQETFKILYRERIFYLENSDICGKCGERFLLVDLLQTDDYVFYCNGCFIL